MLLIFRFSLTSPQLCPVEVAKPSKPRDFFVTDAPGKILYQIFLVF